MCLSPIRVRNPAKSLRKRSEQPFLDVPCGRCAECLSKKRLEWVLRLKLEYQSCDSAFAITLTYSDENLPIKLDKRDIQKFIKRMRYYFQDYKTIKYLVVGEYGDRTKRPHWHCVFFNAVLKPGQDLYKVLNNLWPDIWYVGDNKGACYTYMLKYILKGAIYDEFKPVRYMSKGLGLGYLQYNNGKMLNYHRKTKSLTIVTFDGQRSFMPRYIREKVWPDENERKKVVLNAISDLKLRGIIKDEFEMYLPQGSNVDPRGNKIQFLNNRLNSISKIQHGL